jgi:hypothetical protein
MQRLIDQPQQVDIELSNADFSINPENHVGYDTITTDDDINLNEYLQNPENVAFYLNTNKIYLYNKTTLQVFYDNINNAEKRNGLVSLRKMGIILNNYVLRSDIHKIINNPNIKCVYINMKPSEVFKNKYGNKIYQLQNINFDYSIIMQEKEEEMDITEKKRTNDGELTPDNVEGGKRRGTKRRIKRGTKRRIKRGTKRRIKRGTKRRIKRGTKRRIKRGTKRRIKRGTKRRNRRKNRI